MTKQAGHRVFLSWSRLGRSGTTERTGGPSGGIVVPMSLPYRDDDDSGRRERDTCARPKQPVCGVGR